MEHKINDFKYMSIGELNQVDTKTMNGEERQIFEEIKHKTFVTIQHPAKTGI